MQENPREHSVVDTQEDLPTGDRAGIHPLPNALDPLAVAAAVMNSITEMFLKHQSLESLYSCALYCAVEARIPSQVSPAEEDRSVRMETYRKSVATAVAHALELSESFLVNLEQFKLINVIDPLYRDQLPFDKLPRMMMVLIDGFHKSIMIEQNIKSVLWKSEKYLQLVDKGEALHKQIVSKDRAEQEKAEEEAAVETAAAQKLTEEHRVPAAGTTTGRGEGYS